ncbi:hypothetical protein [Paenibacillus hamazuiensis]|uniref:hypothetical protein n=1 Tax=Paenibacillus hamazuiensis TaxID=2936508 RepID=UPI00200E30D8|nr:hypothetical protein [Paenibacillus hamazuiensis]
MNLNDIVDSMDFSTGWWYPVVLGLFLLLFVAFMPKRGVNWREIYLTFGVIAGLVWATDTVFAVWFDLFDVGEPHKRGIGEFFLYSIIPPSFSVIYLNYYEERHKLLYTLIFTSLSGLAEWATVAVGLMKLNNWHTLFSVPVYLVVYYYYLPVHLRIMERTADKLDYR